MAFLSFKAALVLAAYVLMNVAFCFLKYASTMDVSVIAIGFVLRLFIGPEVAGTLFCDDCKSNTKMKMEV